MNYIPTHASEIRSGLGFCPAGTTTEAEVKRGQEEMEGFRAGLKVRFWFEEVAVKTLS